MEASAPPAGIAAFAEPRREGEYLILTTQSRRILSTILRAVIGIGLLVYLSISGVINWSALLGLVDAWPVSLAVLFLLFVAVVLTSWRLCVLLKPRSLQLSLYSSVRLNLIGAFFNTCLPGFTGGDVVKIYYATQGSSGQRTEIATIVLLDRAVGMFALLLMPLLAAPLFPGLLSSNVLRLLLWTAAAVAAVMLAGMVICFAEGARHSRILSWTLQKLPLGNLAERMLDTVNAYRHNIGILLGMVGLSLVVHAITVSVILLLVQITTPSGATWPMIVLIPMGFLANALPVTPGGLGVGEMAFHKLFEVASLSGGVEALVGWRILTTVIDLPGLVFYLRGGTDFIHG